MWAKANFPILCKTIITSVNVVTVNLLISPLGLIYFWYFLGGDLFEEGGLIKLLDTCRMISSLSELLFSIIVKETLN